MSAPTGRPRSETKEEELSTMEQRHEMFRGVSIGDLEILFRLDRRTILGRIAGHVNPVGKRGKSDIYLIRDVAPHLVVPVMGVEEYLRTAKQTDLPPALQKDYWNAMRARQAALEGEGVLWQTERVIGVISSVFKIVRTSLLLIPDELDRKHGLSDTQRQDVTAAIMATLENASSELRKQFGGEGRTEWSPGSYAQEAEELGDGESADELQLEDVDSGLGDDPYAGVFDV